MRQLLARKMIKKTLNIQMIHLPWATQETILLPHAMCNERVIKFSCIGEPYRKSVYLETAAVQAES